MNSSRLLPTRREQSLRGAAGRASMRRPSLRSGSPALLASAGVLANSRSGTTAQTCEVRRSRARPPRLRCLAPHRRAAGCPPAALPGAAAAHGEFAATMKRPVNVAHLEAEWRPLFTQLDALQTAIRQKLSAYADGKTLKGDELVGWLGETCGKLHLDGKLVDDSAEHDFVTPKDWRVSVTTRRGSKTGWQRSSAAPRIDGDGCRTHLLCAVRNDHSSSL
jgi:hypothetical protein